MELNEIIKSIEPADKEVEALAWKRLDSLTKPPRSLGRLEECAAKYVSARGFMDAEIENPAILTFAGDHGVAAEGISAYPQEVTPQMVANFANGGAAINVLALFEGVSLAVIDIGVAGDCDFPGIVKRKIARGTSNFVKGPAMTVEQTEKALFTGAQEAWSVIDKGATLIGTGDMGIANTTPSTALYSAFLGLPVSEITGRGTGINDEVLSRKVRVIERAMEVNKEMLDNPLNTLAALGGFEIAGICGAVIGAASRKVPVVIDGFISAAAAVTAINFNKNILDYCFFSHLSADSGHGRIMGALGIKPLLDLELRLGEGTGAVLAFHLIRAGLKIMRGMATFDEAGVSSV